MTSGGRRGRSCSGSRSRPTLSTEPRGPRRLPRTLSARSITAGLRLARATLWPARAASSSPRAGRRSPCAAARARTPAVEGGSSEVHSPAWLGGSASGTSSSMSSRRSAPAAPSTALWWIMVRIANAVVGEPLDDVRDPQRVLAVHRRGDQPAHELVELVVGAGRGHRAVPDVEVEVEVGVGDPVGMVEPERHLDQPPPQRLELVQPVGELATPGRVGREVGVVGPLEDQQLADVQELVVVLEIEEGRVQTGQLLHGGGPPRRRPRRGHSLWPSGAPRPPGASGAARFTSSVDSSPRHRRP